MLACDGRCKIGYTERQTVEQRIKQQTSTAYDIEWQDSAMHKDGSGEYLTDKDIHVLNLNLLQGHREEESPACEKHRGPFSRPFQGLP